MEFVRIAHSDALARANSARTPRPPACSLAWQRALTRGAQLNDGTPQANGHSYTPQSFNVPCNRGPWACQAKMDGDPNIDQADRASESRLALIAVGPGGLRQRRRPGRQHCHEPAVDTGKYAFRGMQVGMHM